MSGYLQRLLDRTAASPSGPPGGSGLATPRIRPVMASQSPVAAADQRLNDPSWAALIGTPMPHGEPGTPDGGSEETASAFSPAPQPMSRPDQSPHTAATRTQASDGIKSDSTPELPIARPFGPAGEREPVNTSQDVQPAPDGPAPPSVDRSDAPWSVMPEEPTTARERPDPQFEPREPGRVPPAAPPDPLPAAETAPEPIAMPMVGRDHRSTPVGPMASETDTAGPLPGDSRATSEAPEPPLPAKAPATPLKAEPTPPPEPPEPPPPQPETIIVQAPAPAPVERVTAERRESERPSPETAQPARPRPRTAAEASLIGALPQRRRVRSLFGVRRR